MGFLRLYLALIVVHAHAGNLFAWPVQNGFQAVQIFFMISGFYMAMVLSGKYDSVGEFYKSRWLRIAAPYYFHLVVIVVASLLSGLLFSQWLSLSGYAGDPLSKNGLAGLVVVIISNFTIFGQDVVLFLSDQLGQGLHLTGDFAKDQWPLYRFLVIPQCWSVALEFTFYLIVPFINRLNNLGLVVFTLSFLSIRVLLERGLGLQGDPWNYRFFPAELGIFCLGMLAWRWYATPQGQRLFSFRLPVVFYPTIVLGVLGLSYGGTFLHWELAQHLGANLASLAIYCFVPILLITLFHITKSFRADRFIGELSYLVYLNHLFIIEAVRSWSGNGWAQRHVGLITAVLSVGFAVVCWIFIFRPFERWRHRLLTASGPASTDPAVVGRGK